MGVSPAPTPCEKHWLAFIELSFCMLPLVGIKYSPVKGRADHQRKRSLGQLNEVLKHRISVSSGVGKESDTLPLSLTPVGSRVVSVPGMEFLTAANLFKTRPVRNSSPVIPMFMTWNPTVNEPSGTKSECSPQSTTTSKSGGSSSREVHTHSAMSSFRKKFFNSGFHHGRRSRSSTPDQGSSSDSRLSSFSSDPESSQGSKTSKRRFRNRLRHTTKSPGQRDDHSFSDTPTYPEIPRVRRSGLQAIQQQASLDKPRAYEPTLSPIHSTPTNKTMRRAQHPRLFVEEIDSGFENVMTNQTNTNATVVPSMSGGSSSQARKGSFPSESSGLVQNTSKVSQRLPDTLGRGGTITGVEMSRLPFSRVRGYSSQRSEQSFSKQMQSKSQEEFSISPSQLFRQLKKFRKHRKKNSSNLYSSSVFYARLDSPGPIVYTGNDYCGSDEMNPPARATFQPPKSVPNRPPSVPGDKLKDAQTELTATAKCSLSDLRQAREESPLSDGSNQLFTPICGSLRSSTDVSYRHTSGGIETVSGAPGKRDSRDEIDFGGNVRVVPETDEQTPITSVPNRPLVKGLDLSSNKLTSLRDLCEEQGGQMVSKRLQGLHRLDMKQNQINELPREMMQVLNFVLCWYFSSVHMYII